MYMIKLKKLFLYAVLLFVVVNVAYAQTTTETCNALVQVNNDLWLVQQNGNPINRLTVDGGIKVTSAISQDGKFIVYNGGQSASNIATLLDATGRFLGYIDLSLQDAITGLAWYRSNLLRIEEHISPFASEFHFVHIPNDITSTNRIKQIAKANGTTCSLSSNIERVACIKGDSIYIENKAAHYLPNEFTNASILQTLDLSAGKSQTTSTQPVFQLEVTEITGKTISLKIVLPDNSWQLFNIGDGNIASFKLQDDASSNGTTLYGISPRIKDKKGSIVTVDIEKSVSGSFSYEGGLSWNRRGNRIAFVEANAAGQQSLLLLNGRSDSHNNEESNHETRSIEGKILVPIVGPINSIEFITDNLIKVVGATQVFELEIPTQGTVSADSPYTISAALPNQLLVNIGSQASMATVQGWTCH